MPIRKDFKKRVGLITGWNMNKFNLMSKAEFLFLEQQFHWIFEYKKNNLNPSWW
jgi:hypothetical protein